MEENQDFIYASKSRKQFEKKSTFKRVLVIIVVFVATISFIYVVKSAYYFTHKQIDPGSVPLIKAEKNIIKVVPEDKGGLQIVNMDKDVYDKIVGQKEDDEVNVLNAPEEAIRIERKGESSTNVIAKSEDQSEMERKLSEDVGNHALAQNIVSGSIKKPEYKVQILASTSRENVDRQWLSLQKENPVLLKDKNHFIEKADLGEKGVFYRLQVGLFISETEAKGFCTEFAKTIKKSGVGCILVK